MLLAILVLVDHATLRAYGRNVRGVDYLVLGGFLLFLATCWVAPLVARRVAILLTMTTGSLLLCDGVFTLATWRHPRPSPWYVWRPNTQFETSPGGLIGVSPRARFTINSRGIRGPEFSPADRYRILCVGGSTTECMYLDDERAWPAVLAQRLGGPAAGVWVGNIGRSGLNACDHATLLAHLPEAREVNCWVVLCGVNDMGHQVQQIYETVKSQTFARTFCYRRPGLRGSWQRPLHRNLTMVSLLENLRAGLSARWGASRGTVIQDQQAMWVTRQQQHRRQGDRHGTLPPLGPWLDEYEAQLQRIATLSRREGVRLVLVTQPTLWRENMPPELEALTLGGQLPGGEFLSNADRARAMAAYNERLMTFARREGIECIDLASALPQSTAVFYDDCHFNEAGAAKVADYLAPHLQADRIALGVK